jgi:hypothetical protein
LNSHCPWPYLSSTVCPAPKSISSVLRATVRNGNLNNSKRRTASVLTGRLKSLARSGEFQTKGETIKSKGDKKRLHFDKPAKG